MILTKEQQAQQYADKRMARVYSLEWDSIYVKDLIEEAFEDGYIAAEQSQWRSVEDELPEDGNFLTLIKNEGCVLIEIAPWRSGSYQGKLCFPVNTGQASVSHWMPLPSLPEINTKKNAE